MMTTILQFMAFLGSPILAKQPVTVKDKVSGSRPKVQGSRFPYLIRLTAPNSKLCGFGTVKLHLGSLGHCPALLKVVRAPGVRALAIGGLRVPFLEWHDFKI